MSLNLIKESGSLAIDRIPTREDVVLVFEELCVANALRVSPHPQRVPQLLLQLSWDCDQEGVEAERKSSPGYLILYVS